MARRTPPEENLPPIAFKPWVWRSGQPPKQPAQPVAQPPAAPATVLLPDPALGPPLARHDGLLLGNGRPYLPDTPLSAVRGVMPAGGHPTQKIIYVNGIQNEPAHAYESLHAIADKANAEVVGIYNATEGSVKDFWQCIKDKLGIGHNPAVETLKNALYAELTSNSQQPVNLMAHSQGALITSRALGEVTKMLKEDGRSQREIEARLSRVNVETFGGAAYGFPDGPHYNHYVNTIDAVPGLFGQGNMLPVLSPVAAAAAAPAVRAGAGAEIHRFTDYKANEPSAGRVHGFNGVYLQHWNSPFARNPPQ